MLFQRYNAMTRIYYRHATAAIVCYSLVDPETFEKAKLYINELHNQEENCTIYLCGTKADLVDDMESTNLQIKEYMEYAKQIDSKIFFTSSRNGQNIGTLNAYFK
jgi:GTPase SAR1 family protein